MCQHEFEKQPLPGAQAYSRKSMKRKSPGTSVFWNSRLMISWTCSAYDANGTSPFPLWNHHLSIWGFPKMGLPPKLSMSMGFSHLNHPFVGSPRTLEISLRFCSQAHIPVWEDMLWSLGRGDAFMYKDWDWADVFFAPKKHTEKRDGRDGPGRKRGDMPWRYLEMPRKWYKKFNGSEVLCHAWCNNLDVCLLVIFLHIFLHIVPEFGDSVGICSNGPLSVSFTSRSSGGVPFVYASTIKGFPLRDNPIPRMQLPHLGTTLQFNGISVNMDAFLKAIHGIGYSYVLFRQSSDVIWTKA